MPKKRRWWWSGDGAVEANIGKKQSKKVKSIVSHGWLARSLAWPAAAADDDDDETTMRWMASRFGLLLLLFLLLSKSFSVLNPRLISHKISQLKTHMSLTLWGSLPGVLTSPSPPPHQPPGPDGHWVCRWKISYRLCCIRCFCCCCWCKIIIILSRRVLGARVAAAGVDNNCLCRILLFRQCRISDTFQGRILKKVWGSKK